MTRTFIALELNEAVQRHLSGITRRMASALPGVRPVDPAGIHLTLAFLGELNDHQLVQAMAASEAAARSIPTFDYRLARPGIFGSPRHPRIIWIGIEEPSGTLAKLHSVLNRELEQRSFAVETRPFAPHLTLARIKAPLKPDEARALQGLLNEGGYATPSPSYHVTHINVMKSELSRSGATYTCLKECRLFQ